MRISDWSSDVCSSDLRHTMNAAWLKVRWLLNRRTARVLLWTVLLLAVAVAVNVAGIYFIGSISGWEQWLADVSGFFLVWRLSLYGATVYGWVWMRRRLLARQPVSQRSEEQTSELH